MVTKDEDERSVLLILSAYLPPIVTNIAIAAAPIMPNVIQTIT
jgi:hypothetical protein